MVNYNPQEIEAKWQKVWDDNAGKWQAQYRFLLEKKSEIKGGVSTSLKDLSRGFKNITVPKNPKTRFWNRDNYQSFFCGSDRPASHQC